MWLLLPSPVLLPKQTNRFSPGLAKPSNTNCFKVKSLPPSCSCTTTGSFLLPCALFFLPSFPSSSCPPVVSSCTPTGWTTSFSTAASASTSRIKCSCTLICSRTSSSVYRIMNDTFVLDVLLLVVFTAEITSASYHETSAGQYTKIFLPSVPDRALAGTKLRRGGCPKLYFLVGDE